MFLQRLVTGSYRPRHLLALALLIIITGIGLLSCGESNQSSSNDANARATAQANGTATALAQELAMTTATALAQANATASVIAANPYPSYLPGKGVYSFSDPGPVSEIRIGHQVLDYGDFALELEITLQGNCAIIHFRYDITAMRGYNFYLCPTGLFYLTVAKNAGNQNIFLINPQSSSAITPGQNKPNLVAIVAQGSRITLYANRQQIGSAVDTTSSHGNIFIFVPGIKNVKVWTL